MGGSNMVGRSSSERRRTGAESGPATPPSAPVTVASAPGAGFGLDEGEDRPGRVGPTQFVVGLEPGMTAAVLAVWSCHHCLDNGKPPHVCRVVCRPDFQRLPTRPRPA